MKTPAHLAAELDEELQTHVAVREPTVPGMPAPASLSPEGVAATAAGYPIVLLGGRRDGWCYAADTPNELLTPYRASGELADLATLFPTRYAGEPAQPLLHAVYRIPGSGRASGAGR